MSTTIFLDIDGTLIDLDQKPTTTSIPPLIQKMQKEGIHFGLNSNRAKEDVDSIIKQFQLDGPFILENGSYMIDINGEEKIFIEGGADVKSIIHTLLEEFSEENKLKASIHISDTTRLYTEQNLDNQSGLHIFMNQHRKYTGSIHHRIDGESNYDFTEKLAHYLNEKFSLQHPALVAVAHTHGNSITIENIGTDKSTGIQHYKSQYPEQHIIAIGDGVGDIVLRDSVNELYAVSNAVEELRAVADYVAEKPITEGVEEILLKIMNKKRG